MKLGYIPTESIEWIPTDEKPKFKYGNDKLEGFRLGKFAFGNNKKQTAYYCIICDKIIIDCKDEVVEKVKSF